MNNDYYLKDLLYLCMFCLTSVFELIVITEATNKNTSDLISANIESNIASAYTYMLQYTH